MQTSQENKIRRSLEILGQFDISGVNHRVLGSMLIAALNNEPHRKIGDVDVLLDARDKEKVFDILRKNGLTLTQESAYGYEWIEASHPECITFSFLLIGTFHETHFSYSVSKHSELTITSEYLAPHQYQLYGMTFTGIPPKSVYEGVKISSLNPKRKRDKQLLARIFSNDFPKGLSVAQAFRIYIFRIRIPYLYVAFSYLYNLYGGIRVLFGKDYYPWVREVA